MITEPFFSILLSILAAISWGINSHLVKKGMEQENHYLGLFIRSIFAFPILFAIVLIWKGIIGISIYLTTPILYYTLISAILVFTGDTLFLIGLKKYTVNIISPITATYPLFTTLILIFTGTEDVGVYILLGTVVIIFGVAAVTSGDLSKTYDHTALIMGLLTASMWGTSIYFVRLALEFEGTDAMGLTGVRMMVIGIMGLTIFSSDHDNREEFHNRSRESKNHGIKYMALSGIIGWVIGASLFFYAVQNIGASIPTPISSTNPIIASIIGLLLGIERLSFKQFFGILLSVTGIVIIISS